MPWIISGESVRAPEGFVLDPDALVGAPLDLGMVGGWLRVSSLTIPPAQMSPQWASSGDSDGQQLVRVPYYQNRDQCQMDIRVNAVDKDDAMAAIGALENKLQEAARLAPAGGLPILWTPGGASTGYYLDMLLGQITDMPLDFAWLSNRPLVTVAFTCKPFLRAAETSISLVSSSSPILTVEVPNVPGDVPAEARVEVTDGSSQVRRYLEWGLEQRYYDHASPAPLVLDSASLTMTGFAGTALAHTGAQGGTTIAAQLLSQPVAVAGIPAQPHVGTFRVKGRIYAPSTAEYWRLSWQEGDGPFQANDYVQPVVAGDFSEVDLGIVSIEPAIEGAQQWGGRIEAYTTTDGGEQGELDDILLYPAAEGYGRIASTYTYQPGVISAHDEFTGTTAGGTLNARTAPAGGAWATSGATTDFVFSDETVWAFEAAKRSTSADAGFRYAILGSTTYTDIEVAVDFENSVGANSTGVQNCLILRWTDANNHARVVYAPKFPSGTSTLSIQTVIGGSVTTLYSTPLAQPGIVFSNLRAVAYASGMVYAWMSGEQFSARSIALATGGTLASGNVGFADMNSGGIGVNRFYDNFTAGTPFPEAVTIYSGRSLELRSDSNLRQSADGSSFGDLVGRGSRLFIPPAGSGSRTTRIAVRATRNDLTTQADTSVADGDTLEATVHYTPRYLAVPR